VRLSWLGLAATTRHDDHDDVVGQGSIDLVHDQRLAIAEARLAVDVGLTDRIGASLVLPYRIVSTSIRYLDASGAELELVHPGIHHRNETLHGLADPMVLGSFSGAIAGVRLTVRGGITIPLGRTEADPFALGDLGLPHEHIQLGTGTVNPVVAVEASRTWGAWSAGASALTQQTFYADREGYQAGDRYAGGVSVRRQLGRTWSARGGVELSGETAERWHAAIQADEGNRGRFDAMLAAGAAWSATPALAIDLAVKVPVVTRVVGGQLEVPAIVELGASWSFGGAPAGHAHHHDDHDDHDEPSLVPVPGKLTIFDFGASWCEPCKVLAPALAELARAHPDTVALRPIDVSDGDSPFDLPHVRIVDARGRIVLDASSEPGKLGALIAAVRAIVVAADPSPPPAPISPAARIVEIRVTERGFEPAHVTVPRGTPVTLRFTRTTEKTCGTEVVLDVDGKPVVTDLPLNVPVDVTTTFATAGDVAYACAMNMLHGTITVE
jgi:thiol-disulfide isomerase/thioredoxin